MPDWHNYLLAAERIQLSYHERCVSEAREEIRKLMNRSKQRKLRKRRGIESPHDA